MLPSLVGILSQALEPVGRIEADYCPQDTSVLQDFTTTPDIIDADYCPQDTSVLASNFPDP